MDFPKKQQQCLIPRYLLQYLTSLEYHHTDPTAPWGGGGGGSYTAGTGIDITNNEISVDTDVIATKSDIPTKTSDLTNDSGYITSSALTGYATEDWVSTELLDYVELSDLATVATTGNYNDLTNKPTIPTDTSDLTNGAGYITSSALSGYATQSWVLNQGYVKTNNTQTITGNKTFSGSTVFTGETSYQGPYHNVYLYRPGEAGLAVTSSISYDPDETYASIIYPGSIRLKGSSNDVTLADTNLTAFNEYKVTLINGLRQTIGEYTFKNKTGDVAVTSEIPDAVSGTNDGTNWTSLTIGSNTYGLAGGGSSYSAGTGIDITNNTIAIDSTVVALKSDIPSLTGYATQSWVTSQGYSTFSGSYNDLTNKPTIPTDTSDLTNGAGYITSSALSDYVTINTEQNITKVKTIYNTSNGHSDIYFKAPLNDNSSNTMGFSAFDSSNRQIGGLQIMNRTIQFNSDVSSTYYYGTFLTNFRNNSNALNTVTGFRVLPSDRTSGSYSINFVAPIGTSTDLNDIYKSNSNVNTVNLVAAVTDGTNTVLANKLGVVDISSLLSGGGTTVSGTNDGTNWTSITIGSDTYGIPSGGGGGGSSLAPQIYNFTSADWTGLTTANSYINSSAMAREGLDLTTLSAGQTVKIDCVFVRPNTTKSYVHQFTLVIPDGTTATESTDTFQLPSSSGTQYQIEAYMVIASNKLGLYWSNTSQDRYISKVKVYPANA